MTALGRSPSAIPFLAAVLVMLTASGCDSSATITLPSDRWSCTRQGQFRYMQVMPTGRAVMMIPQVRTECAQWTRFPEVTR